MQITVKTIISFEADWPESHICVLAVALVVVHAGSSPPFCIHKYKVKQCASQLLYPNTCSTFMSGDTQVCILLLLQRTLLFGVEIQLRLGQKGAAYDAGLYLWDAPSKFPVPQHKCKLKPIYPLFFFFFTSCLAACFYSRNLCCQLSRRDYSALDY